VSAPQLDFIVIGVQKGGTTSLWQYLRRHPEILMPSSKEEPFFSTDAAGEENGLESFARAHFPDPSGRLLGKVTPPYMLGNDRAGVEEIAGRIAEALPEVRLIALLRDPVDRAFSQWRMSVRQGFETRSFDVAATAQLDPDALTSERRRPSRTGNYIIAGEYGRILGAYRKRFPVERLHVEMSADLEGDSAATLDRVLEFLGLEAGFRPPGLELRHNRGGRRLDGLGEAQLLEFLEREVWPRLDDEAVEAKARFEDFYEDWSEMPEFAGSEPAAASPEVRELLQAHYTADAVQLERLGVEAPWVREWPQ
jgi:hypothetical protein